MFFKAVANIKIRKLILKHNKNMNLDINVEKIDSMSLPQLIEIRRELNEIVFRTKAVSGSVTERWLSFNKLLGVINKTIEKRIQDEFFIK